MDEQPAGPTRWKIGAKPAELLAMASALEQCAESIMSAARQGSSSGYVPTWSMHRLAGAAMTIAAGVSRCGRALDAADLSDRLTRLSSALQASMRSRALRYPSIAARRLGDGGKRQFLRLDARGHGSVVEVFGNLADAEHVAVIVPGMTNSIRDYDENARVKGRDLIDAMRTQSPRVAVVSWLGYRTPDLSVWGLVEGAASGRARSGAASLVTDLELIRRMAPESHITVVGHSYGSVVVGEAMKQRSLAERVGAMRIGDVAVLGSPGMNVTSRRALGHDDIDLWAAKVTGVDLGHLSIRVQSNWQSFTRRPILMPFPFPLVEPPGRFSVDVKLPQPRDAVPFAPVHGEDPADRGFGARRFSAAGAEDHGSYFLPGTLSLTNIARIATDRTPVERSGLDRPGKDRRKRTTDPARRKRP